MTILGNSAQELAFKHCFPEFCSYFDYYKSYILSLLDVPLSAHDLLTAKYQT